MKLLVRIADRLIQILVLVASIGVVAMMLHVCADIFARAVMGKSLPATIELVSRYYMVIVTFLPLAWVEKNQGMVSVEVFGDFMSPSVKRFSDMAVALLAVAIYAVLTYTTWITALNNYATGTFVVALNIAVPVWQSYLLPPLGFGLACFVTLIRFFELIIGAKPAGQGAEA